MFDDHKAAKIIEKIENGGTGMLSRSQIVVGTVKLKAIFRDLGPDDREEVEDIVAWYKEARKDKTKELMDADRLHEVEDELKSELNELIAKGEEKAAERIAAEEKELAELEAEDEDSDSDDE
jgi:hypothetical protein